MGQGSSSQAQGAAGSSNANSQPQGGAQQKAQGKAAEPQKKGGKDAKQSKQLAKKGKDKDQQVTDATIAALDKNARPLTKEEMKHLSEGVEKAHEGDPAEATFMGNKNKKHGPTNQGNNRDVRSKGEVRQPRGQNH